MLNDKNKRKSCIFFASDYHFEMISLPYIREKLRDNKKVTILTENKLNETIEKLLERINIPENEKEIIKQIDWSNNLSKIEEIEQNEIIFIKGSKKFIEDTNKKIKEKNVEIIDCYDINEIGNDSSDIYENYKEVLQSQDINKRKKEKLDDKI